MSHKELQWSLRVAVRKISSCCVAVAPPRAVDDFPTGPYHKDPILLHFRAFM